MNLGLIFTARLSVKEWEKSGILGREKKIYLELMKRGICEKVIWFTYGKNDPQKVDGIKIIAMPEVFGTRVGRLAYSIAMPFIQAKWFKKIDVLKTNQMFGAWTGVIAKLLYGKPLIVRTGYTWSIFAKRRNYSERFDRLAEPIERIVYKFCDMAFVTSNSQKEYVTGKYSIAPYKVFVIPNFVDTELFKPRSIRKTKDIVYVGRLHPEKNLEALIKALEGLPYKLDIYGDGEMKSKLETLAKKLKVNVILKGSVSNEALARILPIYKLFVLPSLSEGMPKSLLEAMSSGLTVLVTGVASEFVEHGKTGLLVGYEPKSIREGIKTLMEDSGLRASLGKNAREYVDKNFSVSEVLKREVDALRQLV